MLEHAIKALREKQIAALAHPVVYFHGSEGKAILAILGSTTFRVLSDNGTAIRTQLRDYIVPVDQGIADPEPGDTISDGGREYEVLSISGEPCWRWSDPYRTARRIHTKHIGGDE